MLRSFRKPAAPPPAPTGPRTPRQRAGDAAETAACAQLTAAGCTIVGRNLRFREGELDIVARDGEVIVFVEVRLRSSARFGGAGASVDAFKQRRLLRAAQHWLQQTYGDGGAARGRARGWPACRFDVITADGSGVTGWIRDAFSADE
ncbi:MAG: YraN family protein [Burkholderiaceae bacterium]|jgi:putative endonuclease|nr:YraN family protein [Burkholderiaceae bacterium]